jgi:hypothetical protein
MTSVGISLGDALAYRRPTGTGLAGWYPDPGQVETGEPEAADVSGDEEGRAA